MYDEHSGQYRMIVPTGDPETRSAQAILGSEMEPGLLDEALDEFLLKNQDYDDASDSLGLVGEVACLWKKLLKLKRAVLDGKKLNGETPAQLIRDIFGHSLLAMYYDSTAIRPGEGGPHGSAAVIDAEEPPTKLENNQAYTTALLGNIRSDLRRLYESGNVSRRDVSNIIDDVCNRLNEALPAELSNPFEGS